MAKPLKIAGIFGVIILVLILIAVIITIIAFIGVFSSMSFEQINASDDNSPNNQTESIINILTIIALIIYVLSIFFLYGFVALGKRFDNKMLIISAWILIVLSIIFFVLTLIFYINGNLYEDAPISKTESAFGNFIKEKVSKTPIIRAIINMMGEGLFWPSLIILAIFGLTIQLVFAIGIIKLKNVVPLSLSAGIFEIISIGVNLGFVAIILETIMFFKASKMFEQEDIQK